VSRLGQGEYLGHALAQPGDWDLLFKPPDAGAARYYLRGLDGAGGANS